MVVVKVVAHRGMPHRGELVVVVMVIVRGPKGQQRHRWKAHRVGAQGTC